MGRNDLKQWSVCVERKGREREKERGEKGEYTDSSCALILKFLIAIIAILSGGEMTVSILKYLWLKHVQLTDISPSLISSTSVGWYTNRVITIPTLPKRVPIYTLGFLE